MGEGIAFKALGILRSPHLSGNPIQNPQLRKTEKFNKYMSQCFHYLTQKTQSLQMLIPRLFVYSSHKLERKNAHSYNKL